MITATCRGRRSRSIWRSCCSSGVPGAAREVRSIIPRKSRRKLSRVDVGAIGVPRGRTRASAPGREPARWGRRRRDRRPRAARSTARARACPSATQSRLPTSARTMPRRNPSPLMRNTRSTPSSTTSAENTRRKVWRCEPPALRERAPVVPALEQRDRRAQPLEVESIGHPHRGRRCERRQHRLPAHAVVVLLRHRPARAH